MKKVGVFIPARLDSERLSQKLVRPFGGSTLIDIGLRMLHEIKFPCRKYFLAYDDVLLQKNKYEDVVTIKRSKESAESNGSLLSIYCDLDRIREEYIVLLNPCFPLLRSVTVDKALEFFATSPYESMTSVVLHKNWFFDALTGRCLTAINYKELSTKKCVPVFAIGNAFHMTSKRSFFETGQFLDEQAHLYEIPYLESFDVDDLSGLIVAEALFNVREKIWKSAESLEEKRLV